jgi:transposase InsO family protein
VWCSDVTYIPMAKGFLYLVVIMDGASRTVLTWRLSNTLGADFCVEALEEALSRYGRPEIFNTDQGSQFTSADFTGTLKQHGVTISMARPVDMWTIGVADRLGFPRMPSKLGKRGKARLRHIGVKIRVE